ncbi:exocyst complex component 1-like [Anomaloglossus baeobatrachus]|uniref:exocyst complex component 1-like n=1 Tax=Anomaloglossus baeobatrachus TaxID=238106 RepID=UPI003F507A6B
MTLISILKSTLQRDVFRNKGDKLIHVLPLAKINKEDAGNYLCVSVSSTNDVHISLITVMEEKMFLKCESSQAWHLKDLTLIDGIDHSQDNAEFCLHFETEIFNLEAHSTASKYAFLRCLCKMNHKYLQHELQWIHFDHDFVGKSHSFLVPDDVIVSMRICLEVFTCACLCSCF